MKTMRSWDEMYDRQYQKSDLLWFTRSYPKYFDSILNSQAKKILEVGVGSGMHSILLSLLGYEVIGIDNEEEILKIAEKNNSRMGGKVRFLKADAFSLPFESNSFDMVISQGFFEHFQDKEMVSLLSEQLRVGKEVLFSVPSYGYPARDYGNERLMKVSQWKKILEKNFDLISIEYDGMRFDVLKHFILNKKKLSFLLSFRWLTKPMIKVLLKSKEN